MRRSTKADGFDHRRGNHDYAPEAGDLPTAYSAPPAMDPGDRVKSAGQTWA